jgi:hypothetical protein
MSHRQDENDHFAVFDSANDPVVPDTKSPESRKRTGESLAETPGVRETGYAFIKIGDDLLLNLAIKPA